MSADTKAGVASLKPLGQRTGVESYCDVGLLAFSFRELHGMTGDGPYHHASQAGGFDVFRLLAPSVEAVDRGFDAGKPSVRSPGPGKWRLSR
jgi:hypothetical protein